MLLLTIAALVVGVHGLYSVRSSDSCYSIAASHSLTVPQLIACNSGSFIGCDTLPSSLDVSANCYSSYTAQNGDSCSSIADKFSMPLSSFLGANPGFSCSTVVPGKKVVVDSSSDSTSSSTRSLTSQQTRSPTQTAALTKAPTFSPTNYPTSGSVPTNNPTNAPTSTQSPTKVPTKAPTQTPAPTKAPTQPQTPSPTSSSGSSGGSSSGSIVLSQSFDSASSISALSPTWKISYPDCSGSSTASIDNSMSTSSPNSLKIVGINGYCNHIFLGTDLSSLISGDLYVRFRIRFSQALGSGHVSFLTVRDSISGKNLRMGGQAGIMMWNRESDDATLPSLSPQGIALSFPPAINTWYCIEFSLVNTGGKTILTTWANGQKVVGMSVGNTEADNQWTRVSNYKPTDLKLGFEGYSGLDTNIWFDDLLVSSKPIGC
jgi:LysM repeat protein